VLHSEAPSVRVTLRGSQLVSNVTWMGEKNSSGNLVWKLVVKRSVKRLRRIWVYNLG